MQISLSATFHAMADPARRTIMQRLADGPTSVGELARPLDMTAPAVSHHLKVLQRAGLVDRKVDGQTRLISLRPEGLTEMESWLRELRRYWSEKFDTLEQQLQAGMDREQEKLGGRINE